jgi:hypothetical protein
MRRGFHEADLEPLVASGAVRECKVSREGKKWAVWVRLGGPGSKWMPVRSQREAVRTWASLDTLERFTSGLGIVSFAVES